MFAQLFESHSKELDAFETQASRISLILFWIFAAIAFLSKVATSSGASLPDFSDFFRVVGMNPMNASGLAAAGFLFLCARPTWNCFRGTLLLGLALEASYLLSMPAEVPLHYRLLVSGPGLALGGALGLAYQSVFSEFETARLRARSMLRMAGILALYPLVGAPCLAMLSWLTPQVYDAYGYSVEGALGFWPCNEVAIYLNEHTYLTRLMVGVYSRLSVFVMLAFTINLLYSERCYTNVFFTFIVSGLVAWAFYPLLPMVGPDDYIGLGDYPSDRIPAEVPQKLVSAPDHLPRTCFPSMHGTWILLPYFTVKRVHRLWGWFFGVVCALTIVSTLHVQVGHYFLDLVVSFPFAVGFLALLARPTKANSSLRWRIAALCFFYVTMVAIGIRSFSSTLVAHPYLTWGTFLVGILASFWLEEKLAQASLQLDDDKGEKN